MTHQGRHTAPQSTLYRPEPVSFARHRKPNRRPIGWHPGNLAASALCRLGERMMRGRS